MLAEKQEAEFPRTEIVRLLDDCARMIREFYPVISVASLQLHEHLTQFLPANSRLWRVYGAQSRTHIDIKAGREQGWGPCVCVLEGHTNGCSSVAFSADGGRLVSGSYDQAVRLWDVQTGAHLQVMMGHQSEIRQVTYSPDGLLIASCSGDCEVRIWDAAGLQVSVYTQPRPTCSVM